MKGDLDMVFYLFTVLIIYYSNRVYSLFVFYISITSYSVNYAIVNMGSICLAFTFIVICVVQYLHFSSIVASAIQICS